jgi:thioredoxin reductase (NADPH)
MKNQEIRTAEIIIVGAGPVGLELAAALKRQGADYLHLEARQIGYTISWWPRNTPFFSTPERIELAGFPLQTPVQGRTTGEEYLAYLRGLVETLDLQVNTYEPVDSIEVVGSGFRLQTRPAGGLRQYACQRLVLAVGDMHYPNRLNIPGEDLPHVSHTFVDPHLYFRKRLLIVGGRNSASEAALRCWRAGAKVTLSYRHIELDPEAIKHWIYPDLVAQISQGNIGYLPLTVPVEITSDSVVLEHLETGQRTPYPADFVLLSTGFRPDQTLFEMAGVNLLGERRVPEFNPHTMETNVPGLYVAGTATAGIQTQKYRVFIENSHVHTGRIVRALTGVWPEKLGAVPGRQYELPEEEIQAN